MKKKILAVVLAAAMTMSLAACGGSGSSSSKSDAAGEDTEKTYKIATDTTFAPFEFENDNGEMVGIDLDILAAIAEDQGFEYDLQVVGFSAAVTALESGQADAVIAGMSITDERKVKYDFSEAYYQSGVGMAVKADSDIKTYEDLKGKTVAAKLGTAGCDFAESNADKYGYTVTQFEDSSTMYQDVIAGNSAACFEDYPVMAYEITRGLGLTLPMDNMEDPSPYGFAVMKGENAELLKMFNDGLKNIQDSGKYDEILNEYVGK